MLQCRGRKETSIDFTIPDELRALQMLVRRFMQHGLHPVVLLQGRAEGEIPAAVEWMFRQARIWSIVEGPNEVHRWVIARNVLRN